LQEKLVFFTKIYYFQKNKNLGKKIAENHFPITYYVEIMEFNEMWHFVKKTEKVLAVDCV